MERAKPFSRSAEFAGNNRRAAASLEVRSSSGYDSGGFNDMSNERRVSLGDARMAKAMAHPVRVQALTILNERVASPSEIAEELQLPVSNVAYHVRALLQLGCIEEVEARPVRGALEHRYRAVRRVLVTGDEWEDFPGTARSEFAGMWFQATFADIRHAMESGVFEERSDRHMTFTPLVLDEQAWRELNERLDEVLNEALVKSEASAVRLREGATGGGEVRSRLTLVHYEAPTSETDGKV
jgi:DNA-binding transcriptional ArsR family regulator